ncbi:hypothetical protein CEXT_294451 [Caerostris extrusa]|uniref:Uncharacterized protein n=1 Tax=Caerostris extrusa TaxID=172846 RepID=A0AAV4QIQ9_CAEEX|nr:hypothetical protein CEXT_294451 [Caerostris extrusa]
MADSDVVECRCFYLCFISVEDSISGDPSHHGPSDGSEDEHVPQQPSQHAARSSAHEPTLPRKHSQPHLTAPSLFGRYTVRYTMLTFLFLHHNACNYLKKDVTNWTRQFSVPILS